MSRVSPIGPFRRPLTERFGNAALAIFLSTFGVGSCASNSKKSEAPAEEMLAAEKQYDVAVASFHEGMFSDAKIRLDQALLSNPEHGPSWYLQGVIALHEGKVLVDALRLQNCLKDEGAYRMVKRADELHRKARRSFEKSVEVFEEGSSGKGRAHNSLAVVALYFHEYQVAMEQSRSAMSQRFYTERYSALANLGWAYRGKGEFVEAMTELRQSVLLNPGFCVGRYRLAQVYLDFGMNNEAAEEATKLLSDSRCPIQDAHHVAGAARARLGDLPGADEALNSCREIAPRSCLARQCNELRQDIRKEESSRLAAEAK